MSVTPADIESIIASEFFFTADDGIKGALASHGAYQGIRHSDLYVEGLLSAVTFCVIVTNSGHTVVGESHCQDSDKFDAQIGREEARKDAINKLWPMVVYAARARPEHADVGTCGTATEWPEPTGRILSDADSLADLHGYARPDHPALAAA